MKNTIILLIITAAVALGEQFDVRYLQENADGKIVERVVTLTPSTFLGIDESGQLSVMTNSDFLSAIGIPFEEGAPSISYADSSSYAPIWDGSSFTMQSWTDALQAWSRSSFSGQVGFVFHTDQGGEDQFYVRESTDLLNIEALSGTGFPVRTNATNSWWATRTLTGTAGQITVTNGDGVAGDPTISLPSTITQDQSFTGSFTVGDAAGDSMTVNAGTFIAANATNTASNRIANVGALDARAIDFPAGPSISHQMAYQPGPWVTVGTSPVWQFDGIARGGGRLIGTTAFATTSAQGGGVKYPDAGFSGGSFAAFNNGNWTARFMMFNPSSAGARSVAFFFGLRNGDQFWNNSSIGLYHVAEPAAGWQANTVVAAGARINVGGIVFICSTGGTTGASAPTWGTALNGTTNDNTAVWRHLGPHTANKWALGRVASDGTIVLVDTGVSYLTGTSSAGVQRLLIRSDGTNVYASVNGSAEVSISRSGLFAATPFIMVRNETASDVNFSRIGGLFFSFSDPSFF